MVYAQLDPPPVLPIEKEKGMAAFAARMVEFPLVHKVNIYLIIGKTQPKWTI